ncbi:arsenical pump-driving ATPase [Horticoccus sp. 23ND18S-11]|uniref:arsenical pump-driving ATPase n=1 Tax=Horticoccus sp. 23ND18S-11 TaxID=3391832 RepID=UPI0039C9A08B
MNSRPISELITTAPRHLFFTGKGGVGKTSLACATAVALARPDHRVLLVSTDPASNLDEVLATPLSREARAVSGAPGLDALNIDPQAAAHAYREKVVGPMRGLLPPAALRSMEEQLSGACTMEIAAFDEFARLLGDPAATAGYRHVIFDTAPTGHTLRLMLLPRAWTSFLDANTTGTSCLGPLAGLDAQRTVYEHAMRTLTDATATRVVLVTRAQTAALREAERTATELRGVGVTGQVLVINAVFSASDRTDATALALEQRGQRALAAAAPFIATLPHYVVPLRPQNLVGLAALRTLLDESAPPPLPGVGHAAIPAHASVGELLEALAAPGHGVIMTMGKGGVGKTTVAAALAVALAHEGHAVHLTTTDPAAHVTATLAGSLPNLTVSRIDPAIETKAYVDQVMASQGANLDASSRALLEEDLRSPCTEEIAVFRAFARTVAAGREGFVVLDTAPTGHTLLLLDATAAYHRELGRQSRDTAPEEVRELLPRLRDPAFTRVILVTLPEATPVHEAAALQADLRRAAIEPFAWIVNQSFALTPTSDPLLAERARRELPYFEEVIATHATRTAALPWLATEPVGIDALAQLFPLPLKP